MPVTFPLAALTLMLWIIWSDSVRPRKPGRLMYSIRVVLYLATAAALLYNSYLMRARTTNTVTVLIVITVLTGIGGAAYFARLALNASPRRR
ncbi:MAG TPA: hypothetical protein VMT00_12585 [Thermoanaerobaculia bacterium]|nr:hypothetical protein [Thermoanaerobaculia bacterium]